MEKIQKHTSLPDFPVSIGHGTGGCRSDFTYHRRPDVLVIEDADQGGMSVTNDAKNVLAYIASLHARKSTKYRLFTATVQAFSMASSRMNVVPPLPSICWEKPTRKKRRGLPGSERRR